MQPARRIAAALLTLTAPAAAGAGFAGRDSDAGNAWSAQPAVPTAQVRPATAAPATGAAPRAKSKPVRVRIPAAGVDTGPVPELGLAADGSVEVPSVADADRIGWYGPGVTPGETGPAVLIGHFDTVKGPAVLKDVAKVRVGGEISVARADGSTAAFRVRELEQVSKKAFPTRKVYGDTARPELRLITCGGELTDGHRPDNIIVYADLVP
ncbi:class F sortase [Streptomyces sp. NPDC001970]